MPLPLRRIVLVDPDPVYAAHALRWAGSLGEVTICSDFQKARRHILSAPDFLVTNLRLREFNGLHLVHLARVNNATRCIVYAASADPTLFCEAQEMGAFIECPIRLPHSLSAYLTASLPSRDRRHALTDRRHLFRGGRRSGDIDVRS